MQSDVQIQRPSAWTPATLREDDWRMDLDRDSLEALGGIASTLRAEGIGLSGADPAMFDRAPLNALANRLKERVQNGPGMVCLRGWPVAELDDEVASTLYWGLGSRLGPPRPQNAAGDRIGMVTDITTPSGGPGSAERKGFADNLELVYHTENARQSDPPDIIGLLCLRSAAQGGESLLVSGHTIHNRVRQTDPGSLSRLRRPFRFGDPADPEGGDSTSSPVFEESERSLDVRYNKYWITKGQAAIGEPLTEDAEAAEAIAAVERALATTEIVLRFTMAPGEVLLLNNRIVLHGRTEFVDHPEVDRRRCLARLWVS